MQDEEQLLAENNVFAESERQIGTAPLIEMSIDIVDHTSLAKVPYILSVKQYDGVGKSLLNYLKLGLSEKAILAVQFQL